MKELIKKITPSFLINWYHLLLAFFGAFWYGFPSRSIKVMGVTGTKGKTTVVILAGKILEEAGFKVGWISSATIKIGNKEWLNPYHMTMPGRFLMQRYLREMVNKGCKYGLVEVTSEGIKQFRHKFIDFDTVVFTNLAPEHIEAHGGFENYRTAKGELFKAARNIHIVNLDDENAWYFLKFPAREKLGFGIKNQESGITDKEFRTIKAKDVILGDKKSSFMIHNSLFQIRLLGEFNIYNALAGICIGLSQGVALEVCRKALEKIEYIPGRMEFINEGQNFTVIVDLAHTPDSFEKVFKLVNEMPHNRIISVFGAAGGGRDKWKRPELGKIAAHYSDYIILTNEDSYDEDSMEIINQIAKGAEKISINQFTPLDKLSNGASQRQSAVFKILDRREAIKKALSSAEKRDIVLILGKGTEQTMVIGSEKIPWDDREVAREEIKNLTKI